MPTYEYRCTKCGTQFEVFKKITARPGSKCPACGGKAERLLSGGAGLVFKGSGFYITDYARAGRKPAEGEGGDKPQAETPAKAESPKAKKKDQG